MSIPTMQLTANVSRNTNARRRARDGAGIRGGAGAARHDGAGAIIVRQAIAVAVAVGYVGDKVGK